MVRRRTGSSRAAARTSEQSSAVLGEWGAIEALSRVLQSAGHGASEGLATTARLGIGDDAALLEVQSAPTELVWTIDAAIEHVHFERGWLSLRDLGWKATHAAASDLAAMGARPVGALCHLTLPRSTQKRDVEELSKGQAEAAAALGCPVLGGNISSGEVLELVTTVLGELPRARATRNAARRSRMAPLVRTGARVGHELWLVGDVGWAAAGLDVLRSGVAARGVAARWVAAWRRPVARIAEGLSLRGRASACLDVSDGLVGDARHLAQASGVALHIDERALAELVSPVLGKASALLGRDALDYALFGGEDYALLATGPARQRPAEARKIGAVTAGQGVWLVGESGPRPLEGGFEHLVGRSAPKTSRPARATRERATKKGGASSRSAR